jgi:glycosyltransferase involved in cell wall biosynthesis
VEENMKIGVMLRTMDRTRGGVATYTQYMMDHLLPLDRKNKYVLFYYNPKSLGRYAEYDHVQEQLVQPPFSLLTFRAFSFPDAASKFLWDQVKIPIAAKRAGVDLLFNPADSVPLFAACKTIMVLQGSEWLTHPEWFRFFDRVYSRTMMPLYYKKASLFLTNSDTNKRNFATALRVKDDKIKTIYFGVDHSRFRPISDNVFLRSIREKYHLEKFILYVGRIYPGKNFGNVIRAFSKIHAYFPHKIVVTGYPRWGYQDEFASIEKLGLQDKIVFVGWVPEEDLVALYNLADLLIFPSFFESFGIPLVEAMACGCPVITSKTGAPPEITGGAALLVDPYKPDEIAEEIRKVLSDETLRKELSERGLQRAKSFSWEKAACETLAVLGAL